jgi:hypothetical protein
VINISNYTGKDNTPWLAGPSGPQTPAARAPAGRARAAVPRSGSFWAARAALAAVGRVLLSWLADLPRLLGDRLFAMNDTEACWRDWQITTTHGGLGRRYRDPQFGTLAECPKCHGAGVTAARPCPPCAGTGRITLGGVS